MHTLSIRRLRRAELPADTLTLARYLIGKILVCENPRSIANRRIAGRIVETEAYVVGDSSGHAFRGLTPRNRSLFLRRGHAYVYYIYGSCYCLNVSSEWPGIGAGVLLRALEPIAAIGESVRIGLTREKDRVLRFYERGNPFVSGPRRLRV
jgi:DNA-3-methyladenine glycosylase